MVMSMELDESLFSQAAGWDAMKMAKTCLAQGHVLSSAWNPPLLRGVVQSGGTTLRASMVIHNRASMENLCACREAREWGKICHHVVAVGLHWLQSNKIRPTDPDVPARSQRPQSASRKSRLGRQPDGTPAKLFIILPPSLDSALDRGKIMVLLEAELEAGRRPLNALPPDRCYFFDPADESVLDHLESISGDEIPFMLQLETVQFASLLPRLVDHPRIRLGKNRPVTVSSSPLHLPLKAMLEPSGDIVLGFFPRPPVLRRAGEWCWQDPVWQPLGLPVLQGDPFKAPLRIARMQVPLFLSRDWPALAAAGLESNFKPEDFSLAPKPPLFILSLKGGLAQLSGLLQFAYDSRIMTAGIPGKDEDSCFPDPADPRRYFMRDFQAEKEALARLQRRGFSAPDERGRIQITGENAVLQFLALDLPKLQQTWTVTLDEQLENRTLRNLDRLEPVFQVTTSGMQWFDLGVAFKTRTGEAFSAAEIQRLLLSGRGHVRLKNGQVAVVDSEALEEWQQALRDCAPQQQDGKYRINQAQAGFLDSTLSRHAGWKIQAPTTWREMVDQQTGQVNLACPPLGQLEEVLRPYQKHGVAWMQFLRENGFSGILADEMGLGKTLQTLAFLQAMKPAAGRPYLVVCPTSLVFNWMAEAARFTPGLKVVALHGPGRHRLFADVSKADLVITSYALIRRDGEKYRGLEFDTLILDEAQHIKNRQTLNAQAVKAIAGRNRLVLTGTPLENSVQDLWSIFDFLMPGYLGTAADFKDRYEVPIARGGDDAIRSRLARRLRPFMLRRLKREVAKDLPERLDQVAYCELSARQRAVYEQVLVATREEVLAATGEAGLARSRMVILTALLRLRQICCDLRLLNPDDSDSSGKMELFGELLEEVMDGGHRLLVFSQFTTMLGLLRERLVQDGIPFCYLDGSTADRAAEVTRFQTQSSIPVFLISLKAGGVGLNLTAADTVIHFDPWWNPAVEDQATDRAHRIGQTRIVTSYKLIARDTIEEKILALQTRKRGVIQDMLGNEEALASGLNWGEIQELLS